MNLAAMPLRQIASQFPAALDIFDRFQIDLCALGEQSLTAACAQMKLSAEQLEEKIAALDVPATLIDPRQLTMTQLIQRIVRVHHRRVRQDLPALAEMAARLEAKHGVRNPELIPMARLTAQLHREMFEHIGREEQVLFPFIARMEAEAALAYPADHACFRSVKTPVTRMMQDHDGASEILDELEQRSHGFAAPENACATRSAFFAGVREFQTDLREHLRLEDEILFPRAIALEAELSAGRQS